MKITVDTPEACLHPLIGAEVVFTQHSEKNKNHGYADYWIVFGKVYTVEAYSDYPNIGDGPQIRCINGSLGDVPMDELDYDIISRPTPPTPAFAPVTITLESQDEVQFMRDAIGATCGSIGGVVYNKLNELCYY